jgi:Sec-independent protein translocase protein TatA
MLGLWEIVGIVVAIVLIYVFLKKTGKKAPEIAKNVGKDLANIGSDFSDTAKAFRDGIKESKKAIKETIEKEETK